MAKPHGDSRGANLSHWYTPFKTIWETSMKIRNLVTSMERKIQVKVSFQDHPPNVPKMNLNLAPPRPQSLKTCIKRVLSRPFRMDLKKDTSFKTIVNRVTNLNPQYMVPVDEATQVVSDPKSKKKTPPAIEQLSSSPPPPGS